MTISLPEVVSALDMLQITSLDALQLIDAAAIGQQHYPLFNPSTPTLIVGLQGAGLPNVRRLLLQAYEPTHTVTLIASAPVVMALDHLDGDMNGSALYVPPRGTPSSYEALQNVSARLRAPDGCPWDRELTWDSLRPFLLEETYELLAALDARDPRKVMEEQGDLLLQIALQAQIAAESGQFRFPDVIAHIVDKLVRRHPHVFGEVAVNGTDEVLANWEAIKAAERAANGARRSPLAGIPPGLPALAQAESYLDRMSRLRSAVPSPEPWGRLAALGPDEPLTPEVLGQALFELVGWALARGVESESALREATASFAAQVATEGWG